MGIVLRLMVNGPIPKKNPTYLESESCDWVVDGEECESSPAAFVGELYYSCEEHYEARSDWLKER